MRKNTVDSFIEKSISKHGILYDYSKVEYVNNTTKVCIICPEHGEFQQTPHAHLNGQGCPYCKGKHKTTESFISELKKKFPDYDYNYSKVEYVNAHEKVCVICKKHGEFWIRPNDLLNGYGCNLCGKERQNQKNYQILIKSSEEFESKARLIHKDKYDYSLVKYDGANKKVEIICRKCGKHFFQTPHVHLSLKRGCPFCISSKLEEEVREILSSKNILFEEQKTFDWLDNRQRLDFFLPKFNVAIECQGMQHFEPVDFSGKGLEFSEKQFEYLQSLDKKKKLLCDENDVKVIYFTHYEKETPYTVIKDKENLLKSILL